MGVEDLSATVAVPNWMVRLAVWGLVVLGSGAVATLVSVVNWAFILQSDVGNIKAEQAAAKVKETDMVHSISSLNKDVREGLDGLRQIQRDVDILKTKSERTP